MSERRQQLIDKVIAERERQYNTPGSEWDVRNAPNDWIAIAASYLTRATSRKYTKPTSVDFEEDLTKAAAVILAALEHIPSMRSDGNLR
jgi:hypothetical protein